MRKNIARGFAVMAAGVVVGAAGISGTGTPGAAAKTVTPRVHSGPITGTPPAPGSRLRIQRYNGPGHADNLASSAAPSRSITGYPYAVAATSAGNAWAVGSETAPLGGGNTLIVRWNGKTWKQVPSPSPSREDVGDGLFGVAAVSASSAWAVGGTGIGTTLIVRWNGMAWKQVPSPNPTRPGFLAGVAAVSARNAWAVGVTGTGTSLILHWNGKTWKRVPSTGGSLYGVAATSASNAWAVGAQILHWNGKTWKRVPSPGGVGLSGVAATSASNAWAVGGASPATTSGHEKTVILHWNGKTWKRVPSPNPTVLSGLLGVAATSATNAWAVGGSTNTTSGISKTLILRWNGRTWKEVPSPSPNPSSDDIVLLGVAATSTRNAWAVGTYGLYSYKAVILRWNGTAWK
jgi:hypothetical protein